MSYEDDLNYLFSLERFGSMPGLERMERIMEKLGNPHRKIRNVIHIAGTNGKGSTAAMISQVLLQAGFRTGLYISPYIIDFRERIQVDNKFIPKKDISRLVKLIRSQDEFLTFFEFTTAMALQYYHEKDVDYLVLETGLGGRLDATNIVPSKVQVITSISLEHTDVLGPTIGQIAAEKAAIIKPGSDVFAHKDCNGIEVIRKEAKKKQARLHDAFIDGYELSLKGEFQKKNAGLAVAVTRLLGIDDRDIRQALMQTAWPGRLEKIGNIILDCAHNPAGIAVMSDYIKKLDYDRLTIVFGVMRDKDYPAMIAALPPHDSIIFTKPKNPRALDPVEIADGKVMIQSVSSAIDHAKKIASGNDLILVTGSCYLVSEARKHLTSQQ